jgi:hypothetical protein
MADVAGAVRFPPDRRRWRRRAGTGPEPGTVRSEEEGGMNNNMWSALLGIAVIIVLAYVVNRLFGQ